MKKKRHALILQLVQTHDITTQEELLELLRQNGFDVTQATVSRDIKELRLVKAPSGNGPAKYAVNASKTKDSFQKCDERFAHAGSSTDSGGNLCAVKC